MADIQLPFEPIYLTPPHYSQATICPPLVRREVGFVPRRTSVSMSAFRRLQLEDLEVQKQDALSSLLHCVN
jgi:hypothetical protein